MHNAAPKKARTTDRASRDVSSVSPTAKENGWMKKVATRKASTTSTTPSGW